MIQYNETKGRITKLESGFIELMSESRKTVRDCSKLVADMESARHELGTTFEMMLAIFMRFVSNSSSSKKAKDYGEYNQHNQRYIEEKEMSQPNHVNITIIKELSLVNPDSKVPTKEDLENYLSNLVVYFREGMRNQPYTSYSGFKPGQTLHLGDAGHIDMGHPPMIEV